MNRRESLKAIGFSAISSSVLIDACKTKDKEPQKDAVASSDNNAGREEAEIERDKKLNSETYFTAHEMATVTLLADIIIPKDDRSGSASDAKVPEFIEFIVKDIPEHKLPMRGGLRWLDTQCLNLYNNTFKDCSSREQLEMIDRIAYPEEAKPDMKQGVAFFNRMRDLTASGFFTSKMGIDDLGYMGNRPGAWDGVPTDVLKKYGMENV